MQNVFHEFLTTMDPAPVRTWSLILTFYGDCIMPRGGELWLTNLSHILRALGVKPNSARAAMSRLERDGILERRRVGRTSHYALSEGAIALSRKAETVIYRRRAPVSEPGWDVIAMPAGMADRKHLKAQGFQVLLPGLFLRPARGGSNDAPPEGALTMTAFGDDADIAKTLYSLDGIAASYRDFIDAVPLISGNAASATPLEALLLRLGLVHGFRRIVLRDPHLCPAALPKGWPADLAYERFADTYALLLPASETWLDRHAHNAAGPLAPPTVGSRFFMDAAV